MKSTYILLIAILLHGCAAFDTPRVDVPFVVLEVNESVNRTPSAPDDMIWGKEDHWATPKEFYANGAGDCEDYAISKYFALREAGIPASRMLLAVGEIDDGDSVHAVLFVTYKETFVLDNIIERVTPINEYIDFKVMYKFNEDWLYINNMKLKPNYLLKWNSVLRRMAAEKLIKQLERDNE